MTHRQEGGLQSCSIALATCNGGQYLQALLDSLLAQQHCPSEIVVSDDASDDASPEIIERFAGNTGSSVRLLRNSRRLGVAENFGMAMAACKGDWIALCDQDDVWLPEKLAKLSAAISGISETVMAVFSDAQVVDARLRPFGYSMWQQVGFTPERRRLIQDDRPWEVLFKDPVVTGATLMFRRELLPHVLPIPDSWVHDAWIAQIAASQGRLIAVDEPLILYRQHAGNVIGGKKRTWLEQFRRAGSTGRLGLVERELRRYRDLHDRLTIFPASGRRDIMLALVDAKLDHLSRRQQLPDSRFRRGPVIWQEWRRGNYRRFAKDWRNLAADLLMP